MAQTSRWLELTITCSPQLTDAVTDYLVGVFDAGVEVGVEDDLLEHNLHAYLEMADLEEANIAEVVGRLKDYLDGLAAIFKVDAPVLTSRLLEDEDWSANWKKHFTPFAVCPGLIVKPTWEEYEPAAEELVIEMDPGMAFGTGHHGTTCLCLGFIRKAVEAGSGTVLDVGTGTGILAMAAALFGASDVLAIDNDPVAVEAARGNVVQNGLQAKVTVAGTPVAEVEETFSLVVANIIHDVLLTMVKDLKKLTRPGGSLVLSGILRGAQAENIAGVYGKAGFSLAGREENGEWAALHFVRNEESRAE